MSKLEVNIPEDMITDAIRGRVVEALSKGKGEAIMEAIVKAAMEEKDPRSYGRTTLFHKAVSDMIRDETKAIFAEWLTKHREELREKLMQHLNSRKQAPLKQLCESIVKNIGTHRIDVHFRLKDE